MRTVSSTSFADGAEIPAKYAGSGRVAATELDGCTSQHGCVCPHHARRGRQIPAGNLHNDITHWVVYNIPASATSIPEGGPIPSGAGQLSMRGPQYMGPAPPVTPFHHYVFQVYAPTRPLELAAGDPR